MTVRDLESKMDKAINDFAEIIKAQYEEGSNKPASEKDIIEVSRQCFYALHAMKDAVVEYLSKM